jgi:hypothetical protein
MRKSGGNEKRGKRKREAGQGSGREEEGDLARTGGDRE